MNHEYRGGLTPSSVAELIAAGHHLVVESEAGCGIDFDDDEYRDAGARIVDSAGEVFAAADMIVKVKEPQPGEIALRSEEHTSELKSLMRISYADFCLKKTKKNEQTTRTIT